MRNFATLIFAVLLSACLGSCQKWEEPSTPGSITVMTEPQAGGESAAGGTRKVTIAATGAWTAVSDKGWLYVSPSSGAAGIQEVMVTFYENTTGKNRSGNIIFTSGTRNGTFTLSQSN